MSYSINITDLAEEDILSTVRYIDNALKNPVAANNLLDEIERHEKILEDTPYIYPYVQDEYLSGKGIKYVIVKKYLIFYTIDEDSKTVNVIRFLYGSRDWINILKETNIEN
jgi:plasmid stabilization system protein ParE